MKTKLFLVIISIWGTFVYGQSTLTVNCLANQQDAVYNQIQINGSIVEYGLCTTEPAFYVTVIDTLCNPWGTKFFTQNTEHDYHYYNVEGNCRPRVEFFFVYRQTDQNELMYLDSLLNIWIPQNHVIAIWTPVHYSFDEVNTLCPQLGNTLISKWGSVVQTDSMIVLFGVQGLTQSFDIAVQNASDTVSLSKLICPYSTLGIPETNEPAQKSILKVVDVFGRECEPHSNELLIYIYSDGSSDKIYKVEY